MTIISKEEVGQQYLPWSWNGELGVHSNIHDHILFLWAELYLIHFGTFLRSYVHS
jgi:hypothetical protein